jgi:hypothetical protein
VSLNALLVLQKISLFVQTAGNELGGNASLFCCHPKECDAILFLVKTGQHKGSLLLWSDNYLEICDSTIKCAQFQVSMKETSKKKADHFFVNHAIKNASRDRAEKKIGWLLVVWELSSLNV